MTDEVERTDPTLERLRDADPARGVAADLPSLRANVAARVGVAGPSHLPDSARDLPIELPGDDAAVVPMARRTRSGLLRAAGVAAALALVAVGGYGLGAVTMSGGTPSAEDAGGAEEAGAADTENSEDADGAAPPIALDAPANPQDGSGTDEAGGADVASSWAAGRIVFTASGLSGEPGVRPGWGLDATAAATAERAAQAAAVLGVDGRPELRDGAWYVGAEGELSISLDGTASLNYYLSALDPGACDSEEGCATLDDGSERPSDDAAIAAVRDVMAALGVDPASYAFEVQPDAGSATAYVTAELVIDDQRTGLMWSGTVGPSGPISLWGSLADVVALGDYPVVSEQEAFERLSDPRFGASPTAWPLAATADDMAEEYTPPTAPPVVPATGAPVSWPVGEVALTGARLGVATHYQSDGSVLLVPTYEFTDADGGTWTVVAVADDRLDFSS
ncbi:conserved hypothetical protein [Beutenbergia cavernae DSM 12333]|uniref:Uncharacterized protein n=1 Tax=Beutenbergia cavernae (strain ATCC BAA-8 / DSM 12333 / CCUG 43141 / JCM 11478 / NBRC 16432 / NCIMB 13614 / HKI 0122) TaxID=471853 RepID=C5BYI5_BEUC1|nr:hypothetical protein [Beutenbergia cavernae]ACQ78943.1 conserved hypothetical protein [Beutenbergia cavernae DSM 12333]